MPRMQVWYGWRMSLSRSALFRGRHFREKRVRNAGKHGRRDIAPRRPVLLAARRRKAHSCEAAITGRFRIALGLKSGPDSKFGKNSRTAPVFARAPQPPPEMPASRVRFQCFECAGQIEISDERASRASARKRFSSSRSNAASPRSAARLRMTWSIRSTVSSKTAHRGDPQTTVRAGTGTSLHSNANRK